LIRYDVYNLEHSGDFAINDVSFQQVNDYKDRIEVWKKEEENQEEKTDQFTFRAIISDEKPQRSMLYPEGKITTHVDDMMILLSLAQSRNVFYAKAEDTIKNSNWIMPLGGNRRAHGFPIIMEHEIENFLDTSFTQIRKPKWLEKTGFAPAVFWWLESIYEGRPFETKFVSAFVALEVLANAYCEKHKIAAILPKGELKNTVKPIIQEALSHVKQTQLPTGDRDLIIKNLSEWNRLFVRNRIYKLRDTPAYQWDFMDDLLIRDWVRIRDKFMHEGTTRSLATMNRELRDTRYVQLVLSLQLALVDLLSFGNLARREYIAQEIRKPLRRTFRDGGPFLVTT